MDQQDQNNRIITYSTEDSEAKIEVRMKDETVWLSQKQLAGIVWQIGINGLNI